MSVCNLAWSTIASATADTFTCPNLDVKVIKICEDIYECCDGNHHSSKEPNVENCAKSSMWSDVLCKICTPTIGWNSGENEQLLTKFDAFLFIYIYVFYLVLVYDN